MIDLSQEIIFSLIVRSFFTGAALGLCYEAVRMLRMLAELDREGKVRKIFKAVFLFFTDLIFCLLFASSAILLTYNISGGVFRGCVYLSMGLGLLLYRSTLGKLICKLEYILCKILKKVIKTVLKIITVPIRAIFLLFVKLYTLTIGKIIGKIKCRTVLKRELKMKEREMAAVRALPQMCEKEEEENVSKREGYKKEGRISFGGRRGS